MRKLYEASADVLLSSEDLSATVPGTPLARLSQEPGASHPDAGPPSRLPAVVRGALESGQRSRPDRRRSPRTRASQPRRTQTTHLRGHESRLGARERLANAYAQSYRAYRQADRFDRARARGLCSGSGSSTRRRLARGPRGRPALGTLTAYGALYTSLVDGEQTLESMQALQSSVASVLRQAEGAALTQRKRSGTARLGLVVGLYSVSRSYSSGSRSRRGVSTSEEVSARLGGLPLLGRLPRPPKRLRRSDKLVMLEGRRGRGRTVPHASREPPLHDARYRRHTLTITSALEQEGKSTTVANLARFCSRRQACRARRPRPAPSCPCVLLRPRRARTYQVALGHVLFEQALRRIAIGDRSAPRRRLALLRGGDRTAA